MLQQIQADLEEILKAAAAAILKAERNKELNVARSSISSLKSEISSPQTTRSSTSQQKTPLLLNERGPKVQPYYKIEIIKRELLSMQLHYESEMRKFEKDTFKLECQKEANEIRLDQFKIDMNEFGLGLKTEWKHPETMTIPAEALMDYIEKKIRTEQLQIKNLKARVKNFGIQLNALILKLKQMGGDLTFVDYELIQIEMKERQSKLDQTMVRVTDLKKINTSNILLLNRTLAEIKAQLNDINNCNNDVNQIERKIEHFGRSVCFTLNRIKTLESNINNLELLLSSYEAPSLIDYIRHQYELNKLRQLVKAIKSKSCYVKPKMKPVKEPTTETTPKTEKMWIYSESLDVNSALEQTLT